MHQHCCPFIKIQEDLTLIRSICSVDEITIALFIKKQHQQSFVV